MSVVRHDVLIQRCDRTFQCRHVRCRRALRHHVRIGRVDCFERFQRVVVRVQVQRDVHCVHKLLNFNFLVVRRQRMVADLRHFCRLRDLRARAVLVQIPAVEEDLRLHVAACGLDCQCRVCRPRLAVAVFCAVLAAVNHELRVVRACKCAAQRPVFARVERQRELAQRPVRVQRLAFCVQRIHHCARRDLRAASPRREPAVKRVCASLRLRWPCLAVCICRAVCAVIRHCLLVAVRRRRESVARHERTFGRVERYLERLRSEVRRHRHIFMRHRERIVRYRDTRPSVKLVPRVRRRRQRHRVGVRHLAGRLVRVARPARRRRPVSVVRHRQVVALHGPVRDHPRHAVVDEVRLRQSLSQLVRRARYARRRRCCPAVQLVSFSREAYLALRVQRHRRVVSVALLHALACAFARFIRQRVLLSFPIRRQPVDHVLRIAERVCRRLVRCVVRECRVRVVLRSRVRPVHKSVSVLRRLLDRDRLLEQTLPCRRVARRHQRALFFSLAHPYLAAAHVEHKRALVVVPLRVQIQRPYFDALSVRQFFLFRYRRHVAEPNLRQIVRLRVDLIRRARSVLFRVPVQERQSLQRDHAAVRVRRLGIVVVVARRPVAFHIPRRKHILICSRPFRVVRIQRDPVRHRLKVADRFRQLVHDARAVASVYRSLLHSRVLPVDPFKEFLERRNAVARVVVLQPLAVHIDIPLDSGFVPLFVVAVLVLLIPCGLRRRRVARIRIRIVQRPADRVAVRQRAHAVVQHSVYVDVVARSRLQRVDQIAQLVTDRSVRKAVFLRQRHLVLVCHLRDVIVFVHAVSRRFVPAVDVILFDHRQSHVRPLACLCVLRQRICLRTQSARRAEVHVQEVGQRFVVLILQEVSAQHFKALDTCRHIRDPRSPCILQIARQQSCEFAVVRSLDLQLMSLRRNLSDYVVDLVLARSLQLQVPARIVHVVVQAVPVRPVHHLIQRTYARLRVQAPRRFVRKQRVDVDVLRILPRRAVVAELRVAQRDQRVEAVIRVYALARHCRRRVQPAAAVRIPVGKRLPKAHAAHCCRHIAVRYVPGCRCIRAVLRAVQRHAKQRVPFRRVPRHLCRTHVVVRVGVLQLKIREHLFFVRIHQHRCPVADLQHRRFALRQQRAVCVRLRRIQYDQSRCLSVFRVHAAHVRKVVRRVRRICRPLRVRVC